LSPGGDIVDHRLSRRTRRRQQMHMPFRRAGGSRFGKSAAHRRQAGQRAKICGGQDFGRTPVDTADRESEAIAEIRHFIPGEHRHGIAAARQAGP
jgi:hypothetical protein